MFCVYAVDLIPLADYIVECSYKKRKTWDSRPFKRCLQKKLDLIFEDDRRNKIVMKKVIALSAVLVMGALGMACGDAATNSAANKAANAANTMANTANAVANSMANVSNAMANTANAMANTANAMASNAMKTANTANAMAKNTANSNANKKP